MIRIWMQSWLAALVAFTRLPVRTQLDDAAFARASWQLPLLGWAYGGLQTLLLLALPRPLPLPLSLLLCLALPILLGGALHEDGLGDFADGMLGSPERERRLEIMKDPRLGSYGCLALLGCLSAQYLSLSSLATERLLPALLGSQVLARGLAISAIAFLPYVQRAGSRALPYLPQQGFSWGLAYGLLLCVPAFFFMPSLIQAAGLLLGLLLWLWLWVRGLRRALGGYTGDCLGALIKSSETLLLLLGSWLWAQ